MSLTVGKIEYDMAFGPVRIHEVHQRVAVRHFCTEFNVINAEEGELSLLTVDASTNLSHEHESSIFCVED